MKKERMSNVELLRIIAALGVVLLHYNNVNSGAGFTLVQNGSINEAWLKFIESLFICAVNLFVLVSGYFLATSTRASVNKVIGLLAFVIITQLIMYFVECALGESQFSIKGMLSDVLPANYYAILYFTIYLLHPFINKLIDGLTPALFKLFLFLSFFLFSIWSYVVDGMGTVFGDKILRMSTITQNGSINGYTVVQFFLMYIIGAWMGRTHFVVKKWKSALGLTASVFIVFLMSIILGGKAWSYNNPFVILAACFSFLLFLQIPLRNNRVINELAKAVFACYIFHGYFIKYFMIEDFVNRNIFILILHQLIVSIGVYLLSYIYYKIYDNSFGKLYGFITKRVKAKDICVDCIDKN